MRSLSTLVRRKNLTVLIYFLFFQILSIIFFFFFFSVYNSLRLLTVITDNTNRKYGIKKKGRKF